ncbi:hypothetical protein KKJ17_18205, partial [Xenorhabdus bovienii]|nr:hypothetical protein [Xenorhabdus bovienii]
MKNPNLIPKPFAQNGHRDEIPAGYKSDLPSQKATWDTGFPQITMMPVTAGGLPPSGRDFNGVFNQISDNIVHLSKGGKYKFSQEYANAINGYPKGAILQSDDETKEFQSLIDNNKINFNTESADKVNSAWKLVSTNQILDELNKKLNRSDVVQSIGSSQSTVMSQKAATDALSEKQPKGDYATNESVGNKLRPKVNIEPDVLDGSKLISEQLMNGFGVAIRGSTPIPADAPPVDGAIKVVQIGNNAWPTLLAFSAYENKMFIRTRKERSG